MDAEPSAENRVCVCRSQRLPLRDVSILKPIEQVPLLLVKLILRYDISLAELV